MTDAYSDHPVLNTNKLVLKTNQIALLKDILHQWGWNGATGGLVYGDARIGKTQALQQTLSELKLRDGSLIPGMYFSVSTRDVKTIAGIYRLMCNSLRLHHSRGTQADYLADLVVYYMLDLAHEHNSHFIVLFVFRHLRNFIVRLYLCWFV